ncbi:MAG: NAD-dependent epimerase/dehydratase family protein [Halieaceae bacterium]
MKVLLTGATGFVGRHLVPTLRSRGHEVISLQRSLPDDGRHPWLQGVQVHEFDLQFPDRVDPDHLRADALVHLGWAGLPDYRSSVHREINFPASLKLIELVLGAGVKQLMVTGTCLEYGLAEGCLDEDMSVSPELPYAVAKDELRKQADELAQKASANLLWLRLFYMYGVGQNPTSLLASLDSSIDQQADCFNMSGGEQLRDYAPVEWVAAQMVRMLELSGVAGVFNCCSGRGVTVKQIVEQRLKERGASIKLNLGVYDYPDYEPMAFWGSNLRMLRALGDA